MKAPRSLLRTFSSLAILQFRLDIGLGLIDHLLDLVLPIVTLLILGHSLLTLAARLGSGCLGGLGDAAGGLGSISLRLCLVRDLLAEAGPTDARGVFVLEIGEGEKPVPVELHVREHRCQYQVGVCEM
jgi:hypothetical protein